MNVSYAENNVYVGDYPWWSPTVPFQPWYVPMQPKVPQCPNCGRCPHCGQPTVRPYITWQTNTAST